MKPNKTKEFNLSRKRQDTNRGTDFIRYAYCEEDVKEFIRILKEELDEMNDLNEQALVLKIIDKLAGNKLIDNKHVVDEDTGEPR